MPEVLKAASRELDDAVDEYEGRRATYGERFYAEIERVFHVIDQQPLLGPPWLLEGIPEGVRHVPLRAFPYDVVYVTDPRVVVVAIRCTHREPTYWIDRLEDVE